MKWCFTVRSQISCFILWFCCFSSQVLGWLLGNKWKKIRIGFPYFVSVFFSRFHNSRSRISNCLQEKQTQYFCSCWKPKLPGNQREMLKKKKRNITQWMMWCCGDEWGMKSKKLCNTCKESDNTTEHLISTKDDSKLSGVLKRRKIRQKGF